MATKAITTATDGGALLAQAVDTYLAGRSKHTRRAYRARLDRFTDWLAQQPPAPFVAHLREYIGHLQDEGLSPRSIQAHVNTVKGLLRTAAALDGSGRLSAALLASGEEAKLVLSAIDPKTGMAGGLLFALWLFLANLVNSAMEDGLFRGAMLRHFRIRYSAWGAILLQAFLFALWHLNWPAKHFLSGEASLGEAAFEAFRLLLSTGIGGLAYGYLYHKTDNLWGPFLAHTINNTILNVLFIRTSGGLQLGIEFGLFLAIWLPGYLALIPIIGWWANRSRMPEVQPWGSFEESGRTMLTP